MYGKPPYRFPGSSAFISRSPLGQALVGVIRWNDYNLLRELEKMTKAPSGVDEACRRYRREVRDEIPRRWQNFVEEEMEEFGQFSFFRCKLGNLPQPDPWEGDEERIRHMIQQDKQVIEYAKKLETRRKGNYLTKAVEQAESEESGDDDE
jgi:hypothetical protein